MKPFFYFLSPAHFPARCSQVVSCRSWLRGERDDLVLLYLGNEFRSSTMAVSFILTIQVSIVESTFLLLSHGFKRTHNNWQWRNGHTAAVGRWNGDGTMSHSHVVFALKLDCTCSSQNWRGGNKKESWVGSDYSLVQLSCLHLGTFCCFWMEEKERRKNKKKNRV